MHYTLSNKSKNNKKIKNMKKLFITAVLALSLTATSFAGDANKVNSKATSSFAAEFADAKNVSWTSKDNYVKASFTLDNKSMEAYYDFQGELVGTSNAIEISDLPTIAKRSFAKKYAGYTVKAAIRFQGVDETAYYISAENEAQSVVLKVSDGAFLSVFKSVKK
jgi:hypothetical protein